MLVVWCLDFMYDNELGLPQRPRQHAGVCNAFPKTMIRYSVCIAVIIEAAKNQKLTQRFFMLKHDSYPIRRIRTTKSNLLADIFALGSGNQFDASSIEIGYRRLLIRMLQERGHLSKFFVF